MARTNTFILSASSIMAWVLTSSAYNSIWMSRLGDWFCRAASVWVIRFNRSCCFCTKALTSLLYRTQVIVSVCLSSCHLLICKEKKEFPVNKARMPLDITAACFFCTCRYTFSSVKRGRETEALKYLCMCDCV